tara:strand:- start:40 stop:489 length:450 start_codon:yes stop_codon:yes gene_type:complete
MNTQISVPLSLKSFLTLSDFLREHAPHINAVDAVETAIDYWLDNVAWKPELIKASGRGYTWSSKDTQIFMPDQTEIRMRYKGELFYARVEGDQIMYRGASYTPSTLANTITQTSRNAWNDLWIKRPTDLEWHLASSLRLAARKSVGASK